MGKNNSRASWFLVFNNPQEILTYKTDSMGEYILDAHNDRIVIDRKPSEFAGLSPEELCDKILEIWCDNETKTAACAYCISVKGLHHLHIVIEDVNTFAFGTVKRYFPRAHIAPTMGNKKEAEDYINKRGKFAEKGEQVICIKYHGEIKANQGKRSDLDSIERMLEEGMHPNDILLESFKNEKYETQIKQHYFRKKIKEAPVERTVKVYWHVGASGSGKTYVRHQLERDHPDDVFAVSDYESGYLDDYYGQSVLFLDEFRGQIRFSTLLTMLHGYTSRFHARYKNIVGLWTEVHITSVFAPEQLYSKMVERSEQRIDTMEQLTRRLTGVYYHWFSRVNNQFEVFYCDIKDYVTYEKLVVDALNGNVGDGFVQITQEEEEQIKLLFG